MDYYVYILTNKNNTVLYTGMTGNIERRMCDHKTKYSKKSFTASYNVNKLVYFEVYDSPIEAIQRELQLKAGSRKKKIQLIESTNPNWEDLSDELSD
jgi:putative endonuclease